MERFSTSLFGEAKTLLLATDGSPNSRLAAQEALSLGLNAQTLKRLTVMPVARRDDERSQAQGIVDEVCAQVVKRACR